MHFNSIPFLLFLLIVVLLYNIVPARLRIWLLLVAGYIFYAFNGLIYIGYLLLVTVISYSGAIVVSKCENRKKTFFVFSVVSTLSFLLFFKYTDFAITVINDITTLWNVASFNLLHVYVPVGISFYTFLAVGYLIDVYRGKTVAEKKIIDYALFVSYFPAILSGPIERSYHLLPQLKALDRTTYQNAREGFVLFLWGLFYKVVLADRLALCTNTVFSDVYSYHGISLLAASLAFTFQIYFDFAGYTFMALGTSRFFNIKLNSNFNKPYLAVSLTDFWRRWHISLTSWFRDYLYIPLGGNRVSQVRWCFNIMIVFLVSGLWHGAYYTFIIWGGMHAIAQIIEKFVIKDKEIRTGIERGSHVLIRVTRVFVTFCIVSGAWVFFRASSVEEACYMIKGACVLSDYSVHELFVFKGSYLLFGMSYLDTALSVLFVSLALFMEATIGGNNNGLAIPQRILTLSPVVRWSCYLIVTFIVLWFGKLGVTEFVYFNF